MGDPCASTFSFWRMISKEPSKGGAPFAVIRVTLPLRIWDSEFDVVFGGGGSTHDQHTV